jgi:hypothetical protein
MIYKITGFVDNELSIELNNQITLEFNQEGKLTKTYCHKNDTPTFIMLNKENKPLVRRDGTFRPYTPTTKLFDKKDHFLLPLGVIKRYLNQIIVSEDSIQWKEIKNNVVKSNPNLKIV